MLVNPLHGPNDSEIPSDCHGLDSLPGGSPKLSAGNMCVHSQDPDEAGPGEMATLTSFGSVV